jgi:hypothetical protein
MEVQAHLTPSDPGTILLGYSIGSADLPGGGRLDVIGSGRTVEFRIRVEPEGDSASFDLDLSPIAEAALAEARRVLRRGGLPEPVERSPEPVEAVERRPARARRFEAVEEEIFDGDDSDNLKRARRGSWFLAEYAAGMFHNQADREDVSMVLTDLVSDLLHAAEHFHGEDPEALLDRARRSFEGDAEDGPYLDEEEHEGGGADA